MYCWMIMKREKTRKMEEVTNQCRRNTGPSICIYGALKEVLRRIRTSNMVRFKIS